LTPLTPSSSKTSSAFSNHSALLVRFLFISKIYPFASSPESHLITKTQIH
jgi:hypothetical protein